MGIIDFLESIIPGFSGNQTPPPQKPKLSFDQQAAALGWRKDANGVYHSGGWSPTINPYQGGTPQPQPTAPPQAQPQSSNPNDNGFKFQMGLHSYPKAAQQIKNMFAQQGNPPLAQYVDNFVKAGEKYGVDPRVLAMIGQIESSGGKTYPKNSFNPFGYNAGGAGTVTGPDGKQYINVDQGLVNAGFTSIPMAIDRLTARFANNQFPGYQQFRQNPTISALQQAYNANKAEQSNYLRVGSQLAQYLK